MPIIFHEQEKEFHLFNREISYIFKVLRNGELGQLYFGKRLTERRDFSHLFQNATRDMSAYCYEGESLFSMENIKQEYPRSDMVICGIQLTRWRGKMEVVL